MDYRVSYSLYRVGVLIKKGEFIVKKCNDAFHAKLKLDKYLSKKYDYDQMVADAKQEDDIIRMFGNIFGQNWHQ